MIAALVAVMMAGMLPVTTTTGQAFASNTQIGGTTGSTGGNGVNGGNNGHNACDNVGPAEHNPNCQ